MDLSVIVNYDLERVDVLKYQPDRSPSVPDLQFKVTLSEFNDLHCIRQLGRWNGVPPDILAFSLYKLTEIPFFRVARQ